jgi:hypothetical protein
MAGMEKKYIPYKFPTSLSGRRARWFYIRNHESSLPERTAVNIMYDIFWPMDLFRVHGALDHPRT